MNFKQKQIIDLFTKFGKASFRIWFSGKEGEGEFKTWYSNGQLWMHRFYKNGKLDGEYKAWNRNGQTIEYALYKNGKKID